MEDGGFVEPVPDSQQENPTLVSYVPHHGVYHPRKPGKIRVVFNCASCFADISLNDCLLPGPDLTSSLLGVLLRFRQGHVPFMADIESMFYQVLVPPHQRDILRYLWWPGGNLDAEPRAYRLRVHLFGAASSPSCAIFALWQAADDAPGISEEARRTIKNNFYVDDCLKSVNTVAEASALAKELVDACAFGGFRLTKFVSPSIQFLQTVPQSELAKDLQAVSLNDDKTDPLGALRERALGVAWCVSSDRFVLRIPERGGGESGGPTKRQMLSQLSGVYDPLGMAAPVIIQARIIFRRLTKLPNLGWDDQVSLEDKKEWQDWVRQLPALCNISLSRCLWAPSFKSDLFDLHAFSDASMDAYVAVIYLRQVSEATDEVNLSFMLGKARVSPPKVITIPRLELTAARMATDLANLVTTKIQLPIQSRPFWTDSQTVIKYLRNQGKRYHTFVANRVAAILSASQVNEWRFVPTGVNPADCASRGLVASRLPTSAWLKGPSFLSLPESDWPTSEVDNCSDMTGLEVKVRAQHAEVTNQSKGCFIDQLANHYSTAWRLRRALSFWIRFKSWLRGNGPSANQVTVEEMQSAEISAIAWLQREHWSKEVQLVRENKPVPRSSPLYKLSPTWTTPEQLITMRSRTRCSLPIVPKGPLARRLVEEAHINQAHLGRQATQAAVARKYWIIGLNQYARQAVKGCPACQLRHSTPMSAPMAILPKFRLEIGQKPFERSGVDYFGPFYVQRGRATVKAYGVIFTCAVTRAVHLELAKNLSSQSFIQALRRFICRRGHVKHLVSDNGTNFKGANSELRRELAAEIQAVGDSNDYLQAELASAELNGRSIHLVLRTMEAFGNA